LHKRVRSHGRVIMTVEGAVFLDSFSGRLTLRDFVPPEKLREGLSPKYDRYGTHVLDNQTITLKIYPSRDYGVVIVDIADIIYQILQGKTKVRDVHQTKLTSEAHQK
jgi:hypothetical protein